MAIEDSKRRARRNRPRTELGTLPRFFDVLLKGGRVVDPANGLDDVRDIGIKNGKITAVAAGIPQQGARMVRDVTGQVILPGLIDTHAHIFEHVAGDFALNADDVGIRSGVTTVVDQGGASALTINGFREFIIRPAKTNVLCFISTYLVGGLHGHKHVDLYSPAGINVDAVIAEGRRNRDVVRGIKVHAEPGGYSRWGIEALKLAKQASRALEIPVYIHLGTLWPEKAGTKVDPRVIIAEMEPLLDAGDFIAHPFTRHPSGFVSPGGEIHPMIYRALERGVRIDVGHGSHFSFEAAKVVVKAGIIPFTLGADLHGFNVGKVRSSDGGPPPAFRRSGKKRIPAAYNPTFSLYTAMNELVALGVPELDVIRMVTSNAAEMLGLSGEIGSLGVGRQADISVVAIETGAFTLEDWSGVAVSASKRFRPEFVVRKGKILEVDSPLLPVAERPPNGQDRSSDGARLSA